MNLNLFHDITFYALYAGLALTAFVAVERLIFYVMTNKKTAELEDALAPGAAAPAAGLLAANNVPAKVSRLLLDRLPKIKSRHDLEDASEEAYIEARLELNKNLWLLDTIVTASPLLGLLGTILGIIDTFTVLASSGISDPSGVSAGIGTALIATALGISVALTGLLFFNYFQNRVEFLSDRIKVLILRISETRQPA
ncbi:MotA/TolQ/ExbB proton channel family protein [Nevskia sp.]|uniref:MotA/TolQ/ExbB proton channel family protein n=1 Tax=Nevskia sp. TaxID=1929292 RepID=UPI0025EFD95C|nr:MotA/TolQ/ExbB proton channel family protein [Nevskia sp.]HET7798720.1 MotA/TolQ/ExbB proton channel family protein [Nevskia sp.]